MFRLRYAIVAAILLASACGGAAAEEIIEEDTEVTQATEPVTTSTAGAETSDNSDEVEVEEAPIWPSKRLHPSMFHDPVSGQVVMFSGMTAMQRYVDKREVWALNTSDFSWELIGDIPPLDALIGYGLDTESGQVVAFNLVPTETWSYDLSTQNWELRSPAKQPETTPENPRFGAPMAYDAESDRLILFGGGSPWFMYGDTWAYDYNTDTWEEMSPENPPSPRGMYATAYDAESDRVLLWGGFTGTEEDDVRMWAYDYNTDTWEGLENVDGPQEHHERHGMVYLPHLDRILMYSGMLEDEGVLPAQTWLYDYNTNTWTEVETPNSPPAMGMYGMAYDPTSEKVVVFGGEMTSKYARDISNDIWVFDAETNDWAHVPADDEQ